MPEFNSRQAAKVAAGTKLGAGETGGTVRCVVFSSPATAAWAQNDTIASGVPIPIGSKFLVTTYISHSAMGASVTCDIGVRNFLTKAVVDADGIAAAISVAAAGRTLASNGALIVNGIESVTTEVLEVYATLTGADPTDNAQIRFDVQYLSPD